MKLLLLFLTIVPLTDAWAWASQGTVNNHAAQLRQLRLDMTELNKVKDMLRQENYVLTMITIPTLKQQNRHLTGQLKDLKQKNSELTVNLTTVRDEYEEMRSCLTRVTDFEVLVLISPISIRCLIKSNLATLL